MTDEFYTKHKDKINATIDAGKVKCTSSSGNGTNIVVHCYYIDHKNIKISAYAIRNKQTKATHKYILKVKVISDTKNQKSVSSARNSDKYAKHIFNMLFEKYTKQVALTQLNDNWINPTFVVHKQH